jgi:hypothetical protein
MTNPAIERAVQATNQAYEVIVTKATEHQFSQEEIDEIVASFEHLLNTDEIETANILQISQLLGKYMIGSHKRSLLGVQYRALKDLTTLNFDEYVEYCELAEKRMMKFLTEFNDLVEQKLKDSILPVLDEMLGLSESSENPEAPLPATSMDIEVQLPED